jgi:hypothetical protein
MNLFFLLKKLMRTPAMTFLRLVKRFFCDFSKSGEAPEMPFAAKLFQESYHPGLSVPRMQIAISTESVV